MPHGDLEPSRRKAPRAERDTGEGPSRALAQRIRNQGTAGFATDEEQATSRLAAIEDRAPRFFSGGVSGQRGTGVLGTGVQLNNPDRSPTGGQVPVTPTTEAVREKQQQARFGSLPTDTESDAYFQAIVFGDPDKISEMSAEERAFKFEQFDRLVAQRDKRQAIEREDRLFNEGAPLRELQGQIQTKEAQQFLDFLNGQGPDPRLIPEQPLNDSEQFLLDRQLTAEADQFNFDFDPETGVRTERQARPSARPIPQTLRVLGINSFSEITDGGSLKELRALPGGDGRVDDFLAQAEQKGIPVSEAIFGHRLIDPLTGQPGQKAFESIDGVIQNQIAVDPQGTTQEDIQDTINEFLDDLEFVQNNPVPAGFRELLMERYGLNRQVPVVSDSLRG